MPTLIDVVDDNQIESEPMIGRRVSLLVKSRTGGKLVCLHLSPEAAVGLLADLEQAIDQADAGLEDDGSDAAHDRLGEEQAS